MARQSCVVTWLCVAGISMLLQGCNHDGSSPSTISVETTTTTTTTSSPSPISVESTTTTTTTSSARLPVHGCADAVCCKGRIGEQDPRAGQICDDFFNADVSVAVSMISKASWLAEPCKGVGAVGQDKACFYKEPLAEVDPSIAQAMSVTNRGLPTCLYPGASKYGVVYSLSPNYGFWKWFMRSKRLPDTLCGQCTDGQAVCCPTCRKVLGNMTFDDFVLQKNDIVRKTGHPELCKGTHSGQYNEFDTNGLSVFDLAGVLSVESGGAAARQDSPSEAELCTFLRKVDGSRANWPLYEFDGYNCRTLPSLRIAKYLDCSGHLLI
eukprot:TRINITY_DN64109_c0_g1_i1.p1 TRINITY_DN64109_c0_g1~~TRINITY_DN64109_c0_g1_i1.p1  ORF type:complete len:338 (+),score=35.75 TRINITY_DN64109_c0_g1_i1:48-1016(+)